MKDHLNDVKTILVRCPNWVGDIVMATPVFDCLRYNFPDASLIACVRPYARGILEDGPWFDAIVDCHDKSLSGMFQTGKEIRSFKPDTAILLPNSTRSFLTAKLSGAKRIYGYRRNLRKLFLTGGPEPITDRQGRFQPMPMTDYYLEICHWLGLDISKDLRPSLHYSDDLRVRASKLMKKYGVGDNDIVIGLNPGASFGSSKCWPADHFARLAELFQRKLNCKLILFVGPGEEDIAAMIIQTCHTDIINTAQDRIKLDLLKPMIHRCHLLVTNDTGCQGALKPSHYGRVQTQPL